MNLEFPKHRRDEEQTFFLIVMGVIVLIVLLAQWAAHKGLDRDSLEGLLPSNNNHMEVVWGYPQA